MIHLKNAAYRYPGRHGSAPWALEHIDLDVRQGEYVIIFGPNGSGKSTLTFVFNGLVPHFFGGDFSGDAVVCNRHVVEASPAVLSEEVAVVLQNTDAYLFCGTIEAELLFGLERSPIPASQFGRKIQETLSFFGIEHLRYRAPHDLSGGEKHLAAIASALCLKPRLLVLDEPFAHLDALNRNRLRQALAAVHRSGTTVIVAEHLVDDFIFDADRCLLMESGCMTFDGTPKKTLPHLRDAGLVPQYPHPPEDAPFCTRESLLEVSEVTFQRDGRPVLDKVSLTLKAGERVAVTGPNGSGKTTLVKILAGLLKPHQGSALWGGQEIHKIPPPMRVRHIGVSFQNPNDQFFKVRVDDEVWAGPELLKKKGILPDREWIEHLFDVFGLRALTKQSPYRLSEGEKKRVAVASVLAMNPQVLVLDEPTAGQDGRFRRELAELLNSLARSRGIALVVVTHDTAFARAVCTRRLVLEQGRLVEDRAMGPSAEDA